MSNGTDRESLGKKRELVNKTLKASDNILKRLEKSEIDVTPLSAEIALPKIKWSLMSTYGIRRNFTPKSSIQLYFRDYLLPKQATTIVKNKFLADNIYIYLTRNIIIQNIIARRSGYYFNPNRLINLNNIPVNEVNPLGITKSFTDGNRITQILQNPINSKIIKYLERNLEVKIYNVAKAFQTPVEVSNYLKFLNLDKVTKYEAAIEGIENIALPFRQTAVEYFSRPILLDSLNRPSSIVPNMNKIINFCFDYLRNADVFYQTGITHRNLTLNTFVFDKDKDSMVNFDSSLAVLNQFSVTVDDSSPINPNYAPPEFQKKIIDNRTFDSYMAGMCCFYTLYSQFYKGGPIDMVKNTFNFDYREIDIDDSLTIIMGNIRGLLKVSDNKVNTIKNKRDVEDTLLLYTQFITNLRNLLNPDLNKRITVRDMVPLFGKNIVKFEKLYTVPDLKLNDNQLILNYYFVMARLLIATHASKIEKNLIKDKRFGKSRVFTNLFEEKQIKAKINLAEFEQKAGIATDQDIQREYLRIRSIFETLCIYNSIVRTPKVFRFLINKLDSPDKVYRHLTACYCIAMMLVNKTFNQDLFRYWADWIMVFNQSDLGIFGPYEILPAIIVNIVNQLDGLSPDGKKTGLILSNNYFNFLMDYNKEDKVRSIYENYTDSIALDRLVDIQILCQPISLISRFEDIFNLRRDLVNGEYRKVGEVNMNFFDPIYHRFWYSSALPYLKTVMDLELDEKQYQDNNGNSPLEVTEFSRLSVKERKKRIREEKLRVLRRDTPFPGILGRVVADQQLPFEALPEVRKPIDETRIKERQKEKERKRLRLKDKKIPTIEVENDEELFKKLLFDGFRTYWDLYWRQYLVFGEVENSKTDLVDTYMDILREYLSKTAKDEYLSDFEVEAGVFRGERVDTDTADDAVMPDRLFNIAGDIYASFTAIELVDDKTILLNKWYQTIRLFDPDFDKDLVFIADIINVFLGYREEFNNDFENLRVDERRGREVVRENRLEDLLIPGEPVLIRRGVAGVEQQYRMELYIKMNELFKLLDPGTEFVDVFLVKDKILQILPIVTLLDYQNNGRRFYNNKDYFRYLPHLYRYIRN